MPRFLSHREALLRAHSSQEVARIIEQAVGTLAPEELQALPGECRSAVQDRKSDLHVSAVTILHCDLRHRGEHDIGELMRQIAELYAWASVRLRELEHTKPRLRLE